QRNLRRLLERQGDEPDQPALVLLRPSPAPYFIVPVPMIELPGTLYASRLPGMVPQNARAELEALRAHGIDEIVCLVPSPQLRDLHRGDRYLEEVAELFAGRFHQVPILDHEVPPDDEEYEACARAVLSALMEGRDLLVHCVAGCGRTGMFVASLLVMQGMDPIEAILHFRRHRRCGPDTVEQVAYVIRFAQRLASAREGG
ncbi:MAG: tyrosine-protein phosphatase, partial [Myxococcales bacterium]|nr:tyrosine-protein phosphatase [Myxococcales bacterium]